MLLSPLPFDSNIALHAIPIELVPRNPLEEVLPHAGKALPTGDEETVRRWVKGGTTKTIWGNARANRLRGTVEADLMRGLAGNDTMRGGFGGDRLSGDAGNDFLLGDAGNDILWGGRGNDELRGGHGKDTLTGGAGLDQFGVSLSVKQGKLAVADIITDFVNGQDYIQLLGSLSFERLSITQGTGAYANHTLIQDKVTGEYLTVIRGIASNTITRDDFDPPTPSTGGTINEDNLIPPTSISNTTVKFSPGETEAQIIPKGGARISIGTRTIYIGTQQVTSINQNPIIASFDSANPANNWVRSDYEITGTDGRGYGLFWDGTNFYGVFSVDGTQGTPSEDFRRAATSATQSWLRSYGQGGGAKIAVLAKLNPSTGEMLSAAHLSARNGNGNSNSLAITGLSTNSSGNLVIQAQSWFAPRRPDGSMMTQTGTGSSPHAYTLEITSDLTTVMSTSAIGWV